LIYDLMQIHNEKITNSKKLKYMKSSQIYISFIGQTPKFLIFILNLFLPRKILQDLQVRLVPIK